MTDREETEKQLIKAFEMMWGNYNEPVRMIHRSYTVIAVNEACKAQGGVSGVKCNATNPELHKGCMATQALNTKEIKMISTEREGILWTTYWIPVSGAPDYYIHFTNGLNEYMEKLKAASK